MVKSRLPSPLRLLSNSHILCAVFFIFALIVGAGCSVPPSDSIGNPRGVEYRNRGAKLVHGLAACGRCHGATPIPDPHVSLSGGLPFVDKYGEVLAPNITSDDRALGSWSNDEVVQAIRANIGKDSRPLSSEAHSGFRWMSDGDVLAIVAYLRTLPPVEHEVPRREVSFVDRNTVGVLESHSEARGFVPEIDPSFGVEYGGYLVDHVARCVSCHNSPGNMLASEEYLTGGKVIHTENGDLTAPAINGSKEYGIGGWAEDQIVQFLRTGVTPSNRVVSGCPIGFYAKADDVDLRAIAKYLHSLPPPG